MARQDIDRPVQQSLLERLVDLDPRNNVEPPLTRSQSVRSFKTSVRRDLEWLLNTRCMPDAPLDGLDEVNNSVLFYGLPDISSLSGDSAEDRLRLLRMIENAITVYETRLSGVTVTESANHNPESRQVRFLIQASLRMDPSPEMVYFDTVLNLTSREYEVKGD